MGSSARTEQKEKLPTEDAKTSATTTLELINDVFSEKIHAGRLLYKKLSTCKMEDMAKNGDLQIYLQCHNTLQKEIAESKESVSSGKFLVLSFLQEIIYKDPIAWENLQIAADKGNVGAKIYLSEIYQIGHRFYPKIVRDYEKSFKIASELENSGHPSALFHMARYWERKKKYQVAILYYNKTILANNSLHIPNLGNLEYRIGTLYEKATPNELERAVLFYRQAADNNNEQGISALNRLYHPPTVSSYLFSFIKAPDPFILYHGVLAISQWNLRPENKDNQQLLSPALVTAFRKLAEDNPELFIKLANKDPWEKIFPLLHSSTVKKLELKADSEVHDGEINRPDLSLSYVPPRFNQ